MIQESPREKKVKFITGDIYFFSTENLPPSLLISWHFLLGESKAVEKNVIAVLEE